MPTLLSQQKIKHLKNEHWTLFLASKSSSVDDLLCDSPSLTQSFDILYFESILYKQITCRNGQIKIVTINFEKWIRSPCNDLVEYLQKHSPDQLDAVRRAELVNILRPSFVGFLDKKINDWKVGKVEELLVCFFLPDLPDWLMLLSPIAKKSNVKYLKQIAPDSHYGPTPLPVSHSLGLILQSQISPFETNCILDPCAGTCSTLISIEKMFKVQHLLFATDISPNYFDAHSNTIEYITSDIKSNIWMNNFFDAIITDLPYDLRVKSAHSENGNLVQALFNLSIKVLKKGKKLSFWFIDKDTDEYIISEGISHGFIYESCISDQMEINKSNGFKRKLWTFIKPPKIIEEDIAASSITDTSIVLAPYSAPYHFTVIEPLCSHKKLTKINPTSCISPVFFTITDKAGHNSIFQFARNGNYSSFTKMWLACLESPSTTYEEQEEIILKQLLDESSGKTVLHYACGYDQLKIVDFILDSPLSDILVNRLTAGRNSYSSLIIAAKFGHTRIVERLLQHPHVELLTKDENGHNSFWFSSGFGHLGCLNLLLKHAEKSDLPAVLKECLFISCKFAHLGVFQTLIHLSKVLESEEIDRSFNESSKFGFLDGVKILGPMVGEEIFKQGLSNSCFYARFEIVKYLLEQKRLTEIDIRECQARSNNSEIIDFLDRNI